MSDGQLSRAQIERLLEVSRSLVAELDLELVLGQLVEVARDLTEARYAALGVLNAEKTGLERFIHRGIDEEARRRIGPLPQGRGVLGELIAEPRPLRLDDVTAHPRSYGFPAGHPPMHTFLGVPILIKGEAWGNLYLTEKRGGDPFSEADERLVVVLADWAAVAIDNARLHGRLERRQGELERAVRALETTAALARAAASGMDQGSLARLIAKRARDLVSARRALLLLPDPGGLTVAAAAGEGAESLEGRSVDAAEPPLAEAMRSSAPVRSGVGDAEPGASPVLAGATAALIAPLEFRGGERGLLVALDRLDGDRFGGEDERLLGSLAGTAVTTLAAARALAAEKLELAIEASEQERRRWARELHDETLQELGALQMVVEAMGGAGDAERTAELLERASRHVERGVRNLQGLITELRPASLDELGVEPAVEVLVSRIRETSGLEIGASIELDRERRERVGRLAPELELTIYRLVQESLSNVIKHAGASSAEVRIAEDLEQIELLVRDDGAGFDPAQADGGFGHVGMRERVALVGGSLSIRSEPGRGTVVEARIPARRGRWN